MPFWDIFKEKDDDRASREHRDATVAALNIDFDASLDQLVAALDSEEFADDEVLE